MLAEKVRSGRK